MCVCVRVRMLDDVRVRVLGRRAPPPLGPLLGQSGAERRVVREQQVGVVDEGPRAQVVVIHTLGLGLKEALQVLGTEGEVGGAPGGEEGREGGGGAVGEGRG